MAAWEHSLTDRAQSPRREVVMLRCGVYLRVSTKDGSQDTENQRRELMGYADSQQWQIVAEYIDHESGGSATRAGFRQMMRDAAMRRFDVLLFWSLDRLTREGPCETLQYLNTLSSPGVGYRSFTEAYLDTCGIFKEAIIALLGTIAKQERLRISERVRAGLETARQRGTKTGRPIGRPKVIFRRDEVVRLRAQGVPWTRIAIQMGAGITTVRRAYAEQKRLEGTDAACRNPVQEMR